ncbi:MAG: DUF4124 domain-containing protein, partial [Myxococcales bacterium]|nr:DUF4124 domain-containing protein [Myxococcales bacterium]
MRRFLIAIAVLLASAAGPAAAEIYKWIDGDGQMHFTT